jgi:hypothetical protein
MILLAITESGWLRLIASIIDTKWFYREQDVLISAGKMPAPQGL